MDTGLLVRPVTVSKGLNDVFYLHSKIALSSFAPLPRTVYLVKETSKYLKPPAKEILQQLRSVVGSRFMRVSNADTSIKFAIIYFYKLSDEDPPST